MRLSPDCDRLRSYFDAFTSADVGGTARGGVSRPAASNHDAAVRRRLVGIMSEFELDVRIDDIGNMYGRYETSSNADRPPVIIGSHLDTVAPGGRYDGILGVIIALETIALLRDEAQHGTKPIEIVNFTAEEGARFAPAMLGSGVVTGRYDIGFAASRTDATGATLGEELDRIGFRGDRANRLDQFSESLEAHIEQGTELDSHDLSVGIVSAIRPVAWSTITLTGPGGHAGGMPQIDRADPLLAAARMALDIDSAARRVDGARATIGQLDLHPGSANVVPSRVTFNLDLRAADESTLHTLLSEASDRFASIADDAGVTFAIDTYWTMPEANFDVDLRDTVQRTADKLGITTMHLSGDIGHDSLHLSQIGRSGMIFVRTSAGISHSEDEHVPWDAVLDAAALFANTVAEIAA